MNSSNATLLAIVSVAPANRIQCENPGGCHGVYAAIQQELLAAFEDQATERERALAVLQSMRSGAGLQRINTRPAPSFPSSQRRPQAAGSGSAHLGTKSMALAKGWHFRRRSSFPSGATLGARTAQGWHPKTGSLAGIRWLGACPAPLLSVCLTSACRHMPLRISLLH